MSVSWVGCHRHDRHDDAPTQQTGTLTLKIDHVWGADVFALDRSYTTAHGEQVTVDRLQYYLSNIVLTGPGGRRHVLPVDSSYFLVRQHHEASRRITLRNVPTGSYNGVEFILGVDSARSRMEPARRLGVLDVTDPATGQTMYWTWNSGYIFYMIEGRSPQSSFTWQGQPSFFYHVGGYGGTDTSRTINNLRRIVLPFPQPVQVREGHTPSAHLLHDVSKVWGGSNAIRVAENPTSHFTTWSARLADNYAGSFVVHHVHEH